MGAAEWTGYTNSPTYPPYSSLQPTASALPQSTTTASSSYGYDSNTAMTEHHSNFHIPTGMYDTFTFIMQLFFFLFLPL